MNDFWESEHFLKWIELANRDYHGGNTHNPLYYNFFN